MILHSTEPVVGREPSPVVVVAMADPGELGAAVGAMSAIGIEVIPVRDGVAALGEVERRPHSVALVVAELLLPAMSGRRVCRALSWAGQSVPVLLIGGYTAREVRERAALDPATPFLPRPWSVPDLLGRVSELLRHNGVGLAGADRGTKTFRVSPPVVPDP